MSSLLCPFHALSVLRWFVNFDSKHVDYTTASLTCWLHIAWPIMRRIRLAEIALENTEKQIDGFLFPSSERSFGPSFLFTSACILFDFGIFAYIAASILLWPIKSQSRLAFRYGRQPRRAFFIFVLCALTLGFVHLNPQNAFRRRCAPFLQASRCESSNEGCRLR